MTMIKKVPLLIFFLFSILSFSQIPSYYNDVNLELSGQNLLNELGGKVTETHTTYLSYTPGVWEALKQTDIDPANSSDVILVYGFNDNDNTSNTDRTRGVNDNGGGANDWNREHVYPKSLGTPNLGTSGPGADAHHLRPSDVSRNSSRSNRKFADGSGNSGTTAQGHWYPGDEFKGDVARMIMYMYIRYGDRCLPNNVGIGTAASGDSNMIQLFLDWNAEDPVSTLEIQRNPILENIQGNRNPFIDNPAFATAIWGGPQAEDRFGDTGGGNTALVCNSTVSSFPYNQSFENSLGDWSQGTNDDFNWTLNSGSTPSSNTGPSAADLGSYYLFMESSSPNYSNKRAIINSPCFTISSNQALFSFAYTMFGSSTMGSLTLEASTNGTNWTTIWSKVGNQGSTWQTATVSLADYLEQKVQLRFNGLTGTTWQGDIAIDNIRLTSSNSSGGGSSSSNVNLSITFDNYPAETSWEIQNSSNTVVSSGGSYDGQAEGTTLNVPLELENGCYSLTFNDSYGDGMCCSYGNGSYTLTNSVTGAVLESGGEFSTSITEDFCLGSSSLKVNLNSFGQVDDDFNFEKIENGFYPNPVSDIIVIDADDNSIYTIYDTIGNAVQTGIITPRINLQSLPTGVYVLCFLKDENKIFKRLIKE